MKKLKVLSNVNYVPTKSAKNERIVSGTFFKYLGTILLFLFLLPYVITSFFHNIGTEYQQAAAILDGGRYEAGALYVENTTAAGSERIPLEVYVLDQLSRTINSESEPETLKAQAVVLRTALVEQMWDGTGNMQGARAVSGMQGSISLRDEEYGHGEIKEEYALAVFATQGVIMAYGDRPIKAPFFAVSDGKTRNGTEALGTDAYPYLQAVACGKDFLSDQFLKRKVMGRNDFISAWEKAAEMPADRNFNLEEMQIERDSSDYVSGISFQGAELSGEECRKIWGLDSACFQITADRREIIFTVKGVGHGLGMSQFTANEMAKEESDYVEILKYFFQDTQLTKIE